VLRVLPDLWSQGSIGAPNGAPRRTRARARGASPGLTLAIAVVLAAVASIARAQSPSVVRAEFIFAQPPFASAHASTIAETPSGIVAAWFAGPFEGSPDVGIWMSRLAYGRWSAPVEVANGAQAADTRFACWNPVLYQQRGGPLVLFYKVGPSPQEWWGMTKTSSDGGRTWSAARRLPDGILGPIKNKPIRLRDGTILSPSSTESGDSPSKWRVHFERSTDGGRTWSRVMPAPSPSGREVEAIQPSILIVHDSLEALVRTRAGRIFSTWSRDSGKTWSPLGSTSLPNPNAGIDAVTLRDGRHVLVYNHTTQGRSPLDVAVSSDGRTWSRPMALENEPGEYSYPAVIQTSDGLVHITYTWKRSRIKHVVLDPAKLK
jgi:predicted neuraminidase